MSITVRLKMKWRQLRLNPWFQTVEQKLEHVWTSYRASTFTVGGTHPREWWV
jgi:hypothetical protein